jgi:hypothetical protein
MTGYRLAFLGPDRTVVWTHELEAQTESEAVLLAYALAEACSDECRSFELWNGARRVREMDAEVLHRIAVSINGLAQENALRHERRIRDSQTQIARSRKLRERIADLERRLVTEHRYRA